MIFEWKQKHRLKEAFRLAGIYRDVKANNRTYQVFPNIHSVRQLSERLEFVFTLPNGVDPKDIDKKHFVFQQVFGSSITIDGDLKKFILNVYRSSIPTQVSYNYNDILKHIKGHTLPIIGGVDINGQFVTYDMANFPHLLIAGETGAGKSTHLRSMLTTLIKTKDPKDLRLILGDLKRSEFHVFRNVSHVDALCTLEDDLTTKLSDIAKELERRGSLLDKYEKTHISEIQAYERVPYILVCIDEVALLRDNKDAMSVIETISAIGRALGVHLALSMQRPDSKILDGKLKNNLTVRMAFRHPDKINSRITLGETGAEKIGINNRGRSLLKIERTKEIQSPYLNDKDCKAMLDPYRVNPSKKEDIKEYVEVTYHEGKGPLC